MKLNSWLKVSASFWFAAALVAILPNSAYCRIYYAEPIGDGPGAGTIDAPFNSLNTAIQILKPGDTLLLTSGIYRQMCSVNVSGTAEQPITISSVPGSRVVITGADRLRDGWTKITGQSRDKGPGASYSHDWPYVFSIDRNADGSPVLTHPDDQEHMLTGRTEQIFDGGFPLRQVLTDEELAPGTFYADLQSKRLTVWLRGGADPSKSDVEASTRDIWMACGGGASYVDLKGITFRYAANFAQRGAFKLDGTTKHWKISDCNFERANGPGASISGVGHVFADCIFQDNGQLGFGAGGADHCTMVKCGVFRNNVKGYSTGWEAGGLKVALSRGFKFDQCNVSDNMGPGIWFDIGNENSEVSRCRITDNDSSGIFYEISYGLHAHDNVFINNGNRNEGVGGDWGVTAGVTLSSSQNCTIDHNTFVENRDGIDFREANRTTPRIGAKSTDKEVAIWNQNNHISNNIIAFSQRYNIAFWYDTPFFNSPPDLSSGHADPKLLGYKFLDNVLWPVFGRPNYLFGAEWKPRSQTPRNPDDFTRVSGILDNSKVEDPGFTDVIDLNVRIKRNALGKTNPVGARF